MLRRTRFGWTRTPGRWAAKSQASGRGRPRRGGRRPQPAPAETLEDRALLSAIAVTTYDDVVDAGDGQTSLREAVTQATATSGADTVAVAPGYYSLNLGQLEIADAGGVTIESAGAFIDAHGASRVFHVSAGSDATLRRLRVVGGDSEYDPGAWLSGLGGGILNEGNLTLAGCDVTGNHAAFDGGGVENRFGTLTVVGGGFIASNSAVYGGGGIRNDGGSVSVTGASFIYNSALYGAGVSNFGSAASVSLAGVQFLSNTADENGGGIDNYQGAVAVSHGYFSDNSAGFGGGGIRNTEGRVTLEESNFSSNRAAYYGGGLSNVGPPASVTASGTVFEGNSAGTGGGGIDSYLGTVTLTGSRLSFNTAGYLGGGLFNNQATATVDGTDFEYNAASRGGGVFDNARASIAGGRFVGNRGYDYGGAVYVEFGTVSVTDSELSSNSAGGQGGAVCALAGARVEVSDSTLSYNSAIWGGGIYIDQSTLNLDRGVLDGNAAYYGGGLYGIYASLTVRDNTFDGNTAYSLGGGLFQLAGRSASDRDTFTGNHAGGDGGAVFAGWAANVQITRCTATGNSAGGRGGAVAASDSGTAVSVSGSRLVSNSAGAGGAVFAVAQSWVQVADSRLEANRANSGGGALADGSTLLVDRSTLSGNNASFGGGLFNYRASMSLTGSRLAGNKAQVGGGLYEIGGGTGIFETTLWGNHADADGGAIFAFDSAYIQLYRSTAACNSAGNSGGAAFNDGSSVDIFQSTLSGNSAGGDGGAVNAWGGTTYVVASTVTANSAAGNGGGLSHPSQFGGNAYLWDSLVAGNSSSAPAGDVFGQFVSWGHNLIGDGTGAFGFDVTDLIGTSAAPIDPKLGALRDNGGPTLTHALLPGSPAIDGGPDGAIASTDQRGVARPQGVRNDIGAFELEFRAASVAVKPGSDSGPINLKSKGATPVAVLSTATFDATKVRTSDLSLIRLGDPTLAGRVSPLRATLEDVNGDGRLDLVLHFSTQDLSSAGALDASSLSLTLTGFTTDGKGFIGTAAVKIVGGQPRKAAGALAKATGPRFAPLISDRERPAATDAAGRPSGAAGTPAAPAEIPAVAVSRAEDLFSDDLALLDDLLLSV